LKKNQSKPQLKLSEKAQKALSSYSGELSEKVEQLARANAELTAKLNSYGNVANTLKELNLDNASNEEIVGTMKDLKVLHSDFMQNPKFLDVVTAVASGDLSSIPGTEEKRVSDFMPEGESYDAEDAIDDPESPSWKARKKQEKHQRDQENALNELLGSIRGKKESLANVETQLAESKKILNERLGEVKQFATDEYDVSEGQFKKFVDSFKQFDTNIIKVAFAVYAKQEGISNKLARKLEENKDKVFPETKITESPEKELSGSFEIEDKQNKKYSKVFADWEDEESVYR
jgi:hypothetical protein